MAVTPSTVSEARQQKGSIVGLMNRSETDMADIFDAMLTETAGLIKEPIQQATTESKPAQIRIIQAVAVDALDRLAHAIDVSETLATNNTVEVASKAALNQAILARTQDPHVAWQHPSSGYVQQMVRRTHEQINQRMWRLTPDMERVMKRELVRGIRLGLNPKLIARRIMIATENEFNGGLARATNIARTEVIDAYRKASLEAWRLNAPAVRGWYWYCTFGARTCPACLSMHGTFHLLDDPGPDGHQSCRCTGIPAIRRWDASGNEIDEEGGDDIPDSEDWFNNQSADVQTGILGPKRYEAWQAGQYPMSDWAVAKETPGWRRSYVTSPAPDLEDY